ncbi:MAG: SRPBCC family protein [Alphaproteobacteria bacterium]|nr:SRPBCC family protein [Alphaproteobacteria bacterium]
MGNWTSRTTFTGDPERVLELLTDPDEAQTWSPIDFSLEDAEGRRLRTGDVTHIAGQLAGRRMSFDIEVFKASDGQLRLRARGPVEIEVEYGVVARDDGSGELTAWIAVSSAGGLIGRLVASATDAVLAAGALDATVRKIAKAVERD